MEYCGKLCGIDVYSDPDVPPDVFGYFLPKHTVETFASLDQAVDEAGSQSRRIYLRSRSDFSRLIELAVVVQR